MVSMQVFMYLIQNGNEITDNGLMKENLLTLQVAIIMVLL